MYIKTLADRVRKTAGLEDLDDTQTEIIAGMINAEISEFDEMIGQVLRIDRPEKADPHQFWKTELTGYRTKLAQFHQNRGAVLHRKEKLVDVSYAKSRTEAMELISTAIRRANIDPTSAEAKEIKNNTWNTVVLPMGLPLRV